MLWPPPYSLKPSSRARSVRLQMCARRGLQLTIPKNFNLDEIPQVLLQHKTWIEKTWKRLKPPAEVIIVDPFPKQLDLLAVNELWQINYQAAVPADYQSSSSARFTSIETSDKQLIIYGNITNPKKIRMLLLNWLRLYSKKILLPWLQQLSAKTSLTYTRSTIRNDTSRWGSCSAKKSISLNSKLLFLPPHLVEHIMLHELCHTQHLNHSKNFWGLLNSLDPNCYKYKKEIKEAQKKLPLWLE